MTGGYVALVGQTGLDPANRNLCDLYRSITGLPFVSSCKFESLILSGWKIAAAVAVLFLLIDTAFWIGKKVSPALIALITSPQTAATPKIEIAYGEEEPFEKLTSAQLYRLERLLMLEFRNPYPDRPITNCKLEVVNIEPFVGKRRPFVLREKFDLAGGDQARMRKIALDHVKALTSS
jgi:hypothetical protein